MKKIISTTKAPKAVGPYSQAVESNGTLFVSGQIPLDPETGALNGTNISTQTRQVMENLKNIIEEAGYKLSDVVKCSCLLADINDFKLFNEIYAGYFTENPPARVTFQVAALPFNALAEVDAIAVKS